MNRSASEIINTLPALLFCLDSRHQITSFRGSPFIHGHPQPTTLPCTLFDLWPKTAATEITKTITRIEENQPPRQFRYSVNSTNQQYHFKAYISKQADSFAIIVLDASTEFNQEDEKQHLYDQLRQNQKMEALGQLTGGIAHDFNNLLASILGYADLTLDALEAMGKEVLANYLREVINSGEKARDLITQMQAFARAKPNTAITLVPTLLLKSATSLLQAALPETIQLSINSEEGVSPIKIDPAQFNQVVVNLCLNARDAIGEAGNIDIALSSHRHLLECSSCHTRFDGEYVEVSISDNGRGIDPTLITRIFDPFFTTKEFNNNSGMGLSVVHGIVHEHQGHLVVQSQPNYGTTIRLFFPAISEQTSPQQSRTTLPARQHSSNATLLVIDDEESCARLQGELLRNKGFTVEIFSDALQALERYRLNPQRFDLILVDQNMPGISGIEVAQAVRTLRPEILIILNTNHTEHDYNAQAKAAGINALLSKPIHPEQLLTTILDLLQAPK